MVEPPELLTVENLCLSHVYIVALVLSSTGRSNVGIPCCVNKTVSFLIYEGVRFKSIVPRISSSRRRISVFHAFAALELRTRVWEAEAEGGSSWRTLRQWVIVSTMG